MAAFRLNSGQTVFPAEPASAAKQIVGNTSAARSEDIAPAAVENHTLTHLSNLFNQYRQDLI